MAVDPATLAFLAEQGKQTAKVAGSGLSAIGSLVAARARRLTDEERAELEELERMQAAGELGFTEAEEVTFEQQLLSQRAAERRSQEALALQQAAAGGPASGREAFLREQARAAERAGLIREQNVARAAAEAQAAARAEARLQELRAADKAAKAAVRQAAFDVPATFLGATGELETIDASLYQTDEDLLQQSAPTVVDPYSAYI
ncbi:MAG: hypothetical protein ACO4BU_13095 [Phycisphaerales bacterium]